MLAAASVVLLAEAESPTGTRARSRRPRRAPLRSGSSSLTSSPISREQRQRRGERVAHRRRDRQAAERRAPGDAAAAEIGRQRRGRDRARPRAARAGRVHRAPPARPAAARGRPQCAPSGPRPRYGSHGAETRPARHDARRRPQAEHAAPGGRVAQRAAEVAAVGERRPCGRPARPRRRRSSRRPSASCPRRCAWRRRPRLNVCEPAPHSGVLVLPTRSRPPRAVRATSSESAAGHVLAIRRRAVGRAHAGRVLQILVRDRQPVQRRQIVAARAPAIGLVRRRERALGRARHDRVDERVDALDAREVRRDELARRARARAQRAPPARSPGAGRARRPAGALSARRQPGVGDARDVPDVGAAAAAEHDEVRQQLAQRDVARGEIGGIAVVELLGLVELGVAARRGVRAQAADPLAPGAVRRRARPRSASGARS